MDEFVERRRKVTCFESLHGLCELFFNEIVGRETGFILVVIKFILYLQSFYDTLFSVAIYLELSTVPHIV